MRRYRYCRDRVGRFREHPFIGRKGCSSERTETSCESGREMTTSFRGISLVGFWFESM
jgi:hypothetical protein